MPDAVFTTRLFRNSASSRCMFSKRVQQREPRIGAEEHGRIPVGQVQVDEQCRALAELRQRRRDVHGRSRRSDSALGADKREHGAADERLSLPEQARHRRIEVALIQWFRDELGDPGAHAVEHQRRVDGGGEQHHLRRRMLLLECRQIAG